MGINGLWKELEPVEQKVSLHNLAVGTGFIANATGRRGFHRPGVKRGKVIQGNDHWLTSSFKLMLDGFGFDWLVAPGEAEATLSMMTTEGVPVRVDAILTDDSDSFVFGANVVLRIRSEDNENFEASRYSAFDISTILGLCRDDFVLITLLAGGDYSDELRNCGVTTAIGLACV
ncbi:XPGI domain-containing protein [Mycena venus]|uniref:XPGI domain-containing protein n=1 Tax=Mycena venus TaxID=2733690 RepID=A0A8H7CMH1_9AGAR|nr:XPGI domain-containing protein [Mycena venus]